MNLTSAEVKELTTWLHADVDESVKDANDVYAEERYSKIYQALELLTEILEIDESYQDYECMLGYMDGCSEVKCMVANVVADNLKQVNAQSKNEMKLKEWFMSYANNEKVYVQGPYKTIESAMDKAREMLGVTVFRTPI